MLCQDILVSFRSGQSEMFAPAEEKIQISNLSSHITDSYMIEQCEKYLGKTVNAPTDEKLI